MDEKLSMVKSRYQTASFLFDLSPPASREDVGHPEIQFQKSAQFDAWLMR